MRKKGQLAMESVMVYGVVILIVMLAIGALIKFGVFDLSSLMPEKCDLQGKLQCEEYAVQSAGTVQLEFKNNIGKNIEISKIVISGEDDFDGMWGGPDTCKALPPGSNEFISLINGAKKTFEFTGCQIGMDEGKRINGVIVVSYKTKGSDIKRVLIGDIRATVQQSVGASCSGTPIACTGLLVGPCGADAASGQLGCAWDAATLPLPICTDAPSATACAGLSQAQCGAATSGQLGCNWA